MNDDERDFLTWMLRLLLGTIAAVFMIHALITLPGIP